MRDEKGSRSSTRGTWSGAVWAVSLLGLVVVVLGASGQTVLGNDSGTEAPRASAGSTPLPGEVIFAEPKPFAMLHFRDEKVRRLYAEGDALIVPAERSAPLVIVAIGHDRVVVRRGGSGKAMTVRVDQPLPGLPEVRFLGSVRLTRLTYRFTVVEHAQADAVLVAVVGDTAVLEKQVPRATAAAPPVGPGRGRSAGKSAAVALVDRIKVRRLGEHVYELDKKSLTPALERVTEALAGVHPSSLSAAAVLSGLGVPITSDVGGGILSEGGFQITNLQTANTFGLHVGDRIVTLNGRAVNSPLNAWWTLQDLLIRNPRLRDIRVGMVREGEAISKLYVIR